jgi:O-antigen ligase
MIDLLRPSRETWLPVAFGLAAAAIALVPDHALALAVPTAFVAGAACIWLISAPTRWLPVFLIAAIALPPLPFALGDSGPNPALLVAAAGLLAGLLRPRAWSVPSEGTGRAVLVFFFVLLASVAPAAFYSGPVIAAQSLARVALFGISVYVFFYITCGPGRYDTEDPLRTVRYLFWAASAAALFACLDFYFQFPAPAGFSDQYVWLDSGVFRRAQGLFYDASTLGNFCAFFLTMVAAALTRPAAERPVSRPILIAGGILLSAALVFSYSRGSILNLAAAGAALLVLQRKKIPLVRLTTLVALAGAAVFLAAPTFVSLYWRRLSGSVFGFFSASKYILSGRLEAWHTLSDFLRANPWHALAGIGYKTLPYSDFTGGKVIADNMYLSLLVETGIIGLAALIWLHVAILRAAWRSRTTFLGTWIFCFWCGEIAQMMFGDLLTYWRVLPLYFWVLATAVRG